MDRPEKLDDFMLAILNEARRDSLVEICESWGISEAEMYDCIDYFQDELEISCY